MSTATIERTTPVHYDRDEALPHVADGAAAGTEFQIGSKEALIAAGRAIDMLVEKGLSDRNPLADSLPAEQVGEARKAIRAMHGQLMQVDEYRGGGTTQGGESLKRKIETGAERYRQAAANPDTDARIKAVVEDRRIKQYGPKAYPTATQLAFWRAVEAGQDSAVPEPEVSISPAVAQVAGLALQLCLEQPGITADDPEAVVMHAAAGWIEDHAERRAGDRVPRHAA